MYSRFLVFLQFVLIGLVLFPKQTTPLCPFWWIFILLSGALAWWTFRHNRLGNFNVIPDIRENAKLITTGPYRFIRHPMYSSLFFGMLGVVCYLSNWLNWIFLAILVVVLYLKASKEERLWCNHHEGYACYREGTKLFIPFIL
jgi:protein-S-isoprenylcysteine O-methyltransferase Ste14